MKSIGSIANRVGLFTVTVWQVGRWRRRYEFDCDVCELRSARYRGASGAWRVARKHADLHSAMIQQQLRLAKGTLR